MHLIITEKWINKIFNDIKEKVQIACQLLSREQKI